MAVNDVVVATDDTGSAPSPESAEPDDPTARGRAARHRRSRQAALGVFCAYLLGAFIWLLITFDGRYWFIGDDWGMLVDRSLADPIGWFAPQNSHWSTVPTAVYLVLYKLVGLNSYLPYAAAVMVAHLVLAMLLRHVMRRAGVGPWVATIVAGTFVLYGTGQQNIWFAIQISMVSSMVFGVAHLILADHDGPFDRRDALGLAAGAVGLMASGVGPPLVATVGVAVLIRRGWKMAIIHTAPLAALFALWSLWQHPLEQGSTEMGGNLGLLARFVLSATIGVFEGMGQSSLVAALLVVVLVVGLVLAWSPLRGAELRRRVAVPAAMVVGGLLVLTSAGSQRYLMGEEFARSSRYVAMGTALVLPAVAVAAAAIIRRWRYAAPVVLGVVVVGVPGNIAAFGDIDAGAAARYQAQQEFILGAAASPMASDVSRDVLPYPGEGMHQVSIGFLIDGKATGKIPLPPPLSDKTRAKIETRLSLSQSAFGDGLPGSTCRTSTEPLIVEPEAGEQFAFTGPVVISRAAGDGDAFAGGTTYSTQWSGRILTAQLPDQRYRIESTVPGGSFEWCSLP